MMNYILDSTFRNPSKNYFICISHASYKKKRETEKEQQLQDELRLLEETVTDNYVKQIEKIKVQLQEIRNKRMEGITMRSRVKWLQEGEKVSS